MNNVEPRRLQHFRQLRKACRNPKTFPQLLRHERFPIAKSDNFTIRNAMDRLHMLVRNLSATDDSDF
jgi:hypothetical protein